MSKSDDHDRLPMVAASVEEVECVAVEAALKAARVVKDVVTIQRTVAVAATYLEGGEVA